MKIEKLNDNQFRCTIDESDLTKYNVDISELAYGSPKTKMIFRDMMQLAMNDHGFFAGNYPLMIEAVPLSPTLIQIVVTKVEDPDELDTRFSRFAPEPEHDDFADFYEDMDVIEGSPAPSDDLTTLFNKFKKLATASDSSAASPNKANVLKSIAYGFSDLNRVLQVARVVDNTFDLATSLYKEDKGGYYLLIENCSVDEKLSHIFSILKEYSSKEFATPTVKNYLKEHCKMIIPDNAIEQLRNL